MGLSLNFVFPTDGPINPNWPKSPRGPGRLVEDIGFGVAHSQRHSEMRPEMASNGSVEWHARTLCAWHLAILRFAVSLDNADRLNILAIANEFDRPGRQHEDKRNFGFFRKTSSELCAAILQRGETADVILRQYLARIDDVRLRRALAAVLEVERREPAVAKRRSNPGSGLWKGLSSRGSII
jgi:hypothetical protein